MDDWVKTTTTSKLLDALLDPGQQAVWRELDDRYRPILMGLARTLGLDPVEAEEVAQVTLVQFVTDYRAGRFDRTRGKLRAYILGIARHRIADHQRAAGRKRGWRGDSVLDLLADEAQASELWDRERERVILERAMAELRDQTRTEPKTIRAFERLVLEGATAETVAREHDISTAEVYRVKHRLTKRLRDLVAGLEQVYSDEL